jgi:phospholipid/cholesterol/gamma-HCH transport system substrate-binding protein
MDAVKKYLIPGLVVALVAAFVVTLLGEEGQKRLVAHFPRTVSVYEGSDVRVLGVPVGTVETVTPSGTDVVVEMVYDESVQVPADATAVIIAPSIVGDRYVQLTPAYTGGKALADGAELSSDQTSVPLELDQIYASLNDLNVALGPNGANSNGALNDLLEVTAENFAGQGEAFHQAIEDFGRFSATLENNKEELFGAAERMQGFIGTLAENDTTVRRFNQTMADLSQMLAGERDELSAALRNLAVAMQDVSGFVQENRDILGKNIRGLNRVSKVLVRQRAALDEILKTAPVALNNLYLTYNPQTGTLDTRANLNETPTEIAADPALFLCSVVAQADSSGDTCDVIQQAFPRTAFGKTGGERAGDRFDLTLGGFAEVSR